MKSKPHAQLHLPPLSPDDALLVVQVIDRLASAIWRAHGPQMAQRLRHLDNRETVAAGRIGQATVDNPFDDDPHFDDDLADDIPF